MLYYLGQETEVIIAFELSCPFLFIIVRLHLLFCLSFLLLPLPSWHFFDCEMCVRVKKLFVTVCRVTVDVWIQCYEREVQMRRTSSESLGKKSLPLCKMMGGFSILRPKKHPWNILHSR
jgi:hypothetical protein